MNKNVAHVKTNQKEVQDYLMPVKCKIATVIPQVSPASGYHYMRVELRVPSISHLPFFTSFSLHDKAKACRYMWERAAALPYGTLTCPGGIDKLVGRHVMVDFLYAPWPPEESKATPKSAHPQPEGCPFCGGDWIADSQKRCIRCGASPQAARRVA